MNTSFVVADTSVLLKWYLSENEPYREQALLLFDRFSHGEVRILLPDLALYELGNRLVRMGKLGRELFDDALTLLTDVTPLTRAELQDLIAWVERLQKRGLSKLTIYDGAYVQLARAAEYPLVTADEIQGLASQELGVSTLLIRDYR